ncbi:MAG: hypothetical protein J7M26_02015 [Armatimonadetes bacterium]|nr:hypothetical protein [Armatimonadota bacterium]
MKYVYRCPKCKIEREFEEGFIKDHGLQVTKCPRCGQWMAKGPLPLEPPDPKELGKLRKAMAAVREAIARQRPVSIASLKAELAQTRAEIARLQEQAIPEPDTEALLKDALAEAHRLEEELRERESNLAALRKEEEALRARLVSLERAEREATTRELEARLHQPWPGEKELAEVLRKWKAKHAEAFEKAVSEWREQARAVGGVAGSPPGIDELLRRAWERVWAAK